MERLFSRYLRNHSDLFSHSNTDRFYDEWAAKAYLIDREVLRPIVDGLLRPLVVRVAAGRGGAATAMEAKVVAGLRSPCLPAQCCSGGAFNESAPCIDSRFGFQAERFLFKLVPTYLLNPALVAIANPNPNEKGQGQGQGINESDPEEAARMAARRRQRQFLNAFIAGEVPLPSFARIGCRTPLP